MLGASAGYDNSVCAKSSSAWCYSFIRQMATQACYVLKRLTRWLTLERHCNVYCVTGERKKQVAETRQASVDGYAYARCDLDLWPFDQISMSPSRLEFYTWPNFGKILQLLWRCCIHPIFGVNAYCDLDLWHFDPKIWSVSLHLWTHRVGQHFLLCNRK